MKQLFTIVLFLFTAATSYAQSVAGRVVDENSKPIVGAAAMLMALPDSTIVASTITDSSGVFSFQSRGDIVAVSCFGYKLKVTSKNCFFGAQLRIEKSSFTASKLRLIDLVRLEKSNF